MNIVGLYILNSSTFTHISTTNIFVTCPLVIFALYLFCFRLMAQFGVP